jgi:hypothetical protein
MSVIMNEWMKSICECNENVFPTRPLAHACNSTYLGVWNLKDHDWGQCGKNLSETSNSTNNWEQWCACLSKLHRRLSLVESWFLANLGKNICKTHFKGKMVALIAYIFHPNNGEKHKLGGLGSMLTWTKNENLSPKTTRVIRAGGMTQTAKCLCLANSNTSNVKK